MEHPRRATIDDLPHISALIDQTFRKTLRDAGERDVMFRQFPLLFAPENVGNLWVVRDGNQIASHVGVLPSTMIINGCRVGSASIGSVATDDAYRGQGLASQLMEKAIAASIESGCPIMPISGGRTLYTRIGSTPVKQGTDYLISLKKTEAFVDRALTVRLAVADDSSVIAALHRQNAVRYHRRPDLYHKIMNNGFFHNANGRLLLIDGPRGVLGYIALQTRSDATLYIVETGGDARAILGSIGASVRCVQPGVTAERVNLFVPNGNITLDSMAASVSESAEPHSGGTLLVTDPARLLNDLEPYQDERLGGGLRVRITIEGGDAVIRLETTDSETIESQKRPAVQMSALLLGTSDEKTERPSLTPGALSDAVARLTPIPVPPYELNYV